MLSVRAAGRIRKAADPCCGKPAPRPAARRGSSRCAVEGSRALSRSTSMRRAGSSLSVDHSARRSIVALRATGGQTGARHFGRVGARSRPGWARPAASGNDDTRGKRTEPCRNRGKSVPSRGDQEDVEHPPRRPRSAGPARGAVRLPRRPSDGAPPRTGPASRTVRFPAAPRARRSPRARARGAGRPPASRSPPCPRRRCSRPSSGASRREIVCRFAGSKTTRSASEPTAIVPLRGYSPNSFAGFVASSSTIRFSEIRPWRTPSSWTMCSRSSIPGAPFGIFEKSSRPSVFWPFQRNEQWSVEIAERTSLRTAFHSTSWFDSGARRAACRRTSRPRSRAGRATSRRRRSTACTSRRRRSSPSRGRSGSARRTPRRRRGRRTAGSRRSGPAGSRGSSPRPRSRAAACARASAGSDAPARPPGARARRSRRRSPRAP